MHYRQTQQRLNETNQSRLVGLHHWLVSLRAKAKRTHDVKNAMLGCASNASDRTAPSQIDCFYDWIFIHSILSILEYKKKTKRTQYKFLFIILSDFDRLWWRISKACAYGNVSQWFNTSQYTFTKTDVRCMKSVLRSSNNASEIQWHLIFIQKSAEERF